MTNEKWNDSFLKSMSLQSDPHAEEIIKAIVADNDFTTLRKLFTDLDYNNEKVFVNDLPKEVVTYFNNETNLPAWADPNKIKLAQNVFKLYGPEISLLLNFKALPLCYACRNGAKVLSMTGRLNQQGQNTQKLMRRLLETAQMVMNVMSPDGLSPSGRGIITVKKVRLYHAAIRYFLMHEKYNPLGWDIDYYGYPINQEEMAGTLMAFSALIINGLEQLDVELTQEEKDAYIHCWNIVGHFIGLSPELYPANYQEGWNLGIAIINRNKEESEDGKFLTKSLIDFSDDFFNDALFKQIPEYLIGYFVKDVSDKIDTDIVKLLGVDDTLSWLTRLEGRMLIELLEFGHEVEEHSELVRKLVGRFGLKYLEGMIKSYLKTNDVDFYIPDSLRASWRMN